MASKEGIPLNRRTFVGGVAFSTAAGAAVAGLREGGIPTRVFGKTGEKLTIVGQAAGRFPLIDFEEAKRVTRRAYELGINYFDNARAYWEGRSEEVYGAVLPPFRKDVFITTKTAKRTRAGAEEDLRASLKALQTDYIDLWQIHSVSEMDDVEKIFAPGGAIEAFEAAKKDGKCKFIGFTGHRDPHVHVEMMKRYKNFDTILMPLNPADPSYLSFEQIALPMAVEQGLGIQAMKTTAVSQLLQEFSVEQCLRYALSLPVHCATLGATTLGQIEDDVRIARRFQPLAEADMISYRQRAARLAGPRTENWKRNIAA
jgi:predicted aldo/keto reductase-like oxidoreductase